MKNISIMISLSLCFVTAHYSQEESFVLINSSGDTVFCVKANGNVYANNSLVGAPIGTVHAWLKNHSGTPALPVVRGPRRVDSTL